MLQERRGFVVDGIWVEPPCFKMHTKAGNKVSHLWRQLRGGGLWGHGLGAGSQVRHICLHHAIRLLIKMANLEAWKGMHFVVGMTIDVDAAIAPPVPEHAFLL
jgi:hypothetical protein